MIISVAASGLVYLLVTAYFRFWLSRTGTALRHPRSIRYRSPQMIWAFLGASVVGTSVYFQSAVPLYSLPVAYSAMLIYYALRFGALRAFSFVFYLFFCGLALSLNHLLAIPWGSASAVVVAFTCDMVQNWNFKRTGIIVPGPDPQSA